MRKVIVLSIIIFSIGYITGCTAFSNELKVLKKDAEFSEVVFLESGHHIVGIDPDSYEIMIDFEFNTYVTYGDIADDQRIFVADDGEKLGVWGEQLFVISKDEKLVYTLPVFPNSRTVKVLGDRLFVANFSYTQEAYTGLQIFDLNSYQLLFESRGIGNIISKRNIQQDGNFAYIAVPAYNAGEIDRKSYILKVDLATLTVDTIYRYTAEHPYERYDILLVDSQLIIAFNESQEVQVYDLLTDQLTKTIKITDFVDIPVTAAPLDYWFSEPRIIGDNLVFLLVDNLPGVQFQKVLCFDRYSYDFIQEVDLAGDYNLRFFMLKYVFHNHLWIEDGEYVGVYDYQTGQLIKKFNLQLK